MQHDQHGYGFEIAIHDIDAGEEITDEYGLLNLQEPMVVNCGCSDCRGVVDPADAERYAPKWDAAIIAALARVRQVPQPLWHLLDRHASRALQGFLYGKLPYRSVGVLRWERPRPCGNQHGKILAVSDIENSDSGDAKSAQGKQEPPQQLADSGSAEGRRQRRDDAREDFERESFLEGYLNDSEPEWKGLVVQEQRPAAVDAHRAIERYQEDKALEAILDDPWTEVCCSAAGAPHMQR